MTSTPTNSPTLVEITSTSPTTTKTNIEYREFNQTTMICSYEEHSKKVGYLLDNPLLSDVIFEVGNDEIGKRNFHCHKAILASMSDPFRVMFTNGMKETNEKKVVINDIKPDIFYHVLQFIYTGSINLSVSNLDEPLDVLYVSSQYQVSELQNICVQHIIHRTNKNNVCAFFESACMLECAPLKTLTLEYIERHTAFVFKTEGFLHLSQNSMKEIVKSDYLTMPENEIFNNIITWAKFQIFKETEKNLSTNDTIKLFKKKKDEIKMNKESKEMVLPILPFIRFPLMTPDVLLDEIEPTESVPEELLHEAYRFISLKHRLLTENETLRTKPRRIGVLQDTIKLNPNRCHPDITISYDMMQARKNSNSRNWATCVCSKGIDHGRHFWEIKIDTSCTGHIMVGIGGKNPELTNFHSSIDSRNLMYYCWNGRKYNGMTHTQYGSQVKQNDHVGVLLDMDKKIIEFYKNGVSQGIAFTKDDFDSEIYYPIVSLFDRDDQISIFQSTFGK